MNNITGGAGGGGLSGTVDSGRLSQVSGCHGGASNPAAMEKQVFAVLVFFFITGGTRCENSFGKDRGVLLLKGQDIGGKNEKQTLCSPASLEAGAESDSRPWLQCFYQSERVLPLCVDSQGTSTQVEVKPTSQRDGAKTLFPVKTPPGPVFISSVPSGWLINRLMALNRCFPAHCVVNNKSAAARKHQKSGPTPLVDDDTDNDGCICITI